MVVRQLRIAREQQTFWGSEIEARKGKASVGEGANGAKMASGRGLHPVILTT